MQSILSQVRRAMNDYEMIKENDTVYVGVSGGKDSMTLLTALKRLSTFHHIPFTVEAVHIGMGFEGFDLASIASYCEQIQVPFHTLPTEIRHVVFDVKKEKNPCSLCAKMRRGALHRFVREELGGKTIALAHHGDDYIASFLLSLLYEGRIHTFSPVSHMDRSDVDIIRPLIYVREKDIIHVARKEAIPIVPSACPMNGITKRSEMKEVLKMLNGFARGKADERILHALYSANM